MASVFAQRRTDRRRSRGVLLRIVNWAFRLLTLFVLLFVGLVVLYRFVPPVSTLMLMRWMTFQDVQRDWVSLDEIAPVLPRTVIGSEDSRFCLHHGVDWGALQDVIDDADEGGPSRGASTIAMQTAKNVFLWPGRSYLRKGLEIPVALVIDTVWGKRRVMEVYLNVAEWGDGVFGAQAAARTHFRKDARGLSPREAALLAAVLPNPIERDAGHPSRYVARRAGLLAARAPNEDARCLQGS